MLARYLNKSLKEDQVLHYVKRMAGMPHGFVIRYCQDMMNESPPGMPSKFPSINDIEKKFRDVGSPGRASMGADFLPTDCPDCYGHGILWYLKDEVKAKFEYVAKCGSCRNHMRHGPLPAYPTKVRQDLINQGYEVFPYERRRKHDNAGRNRHHRLNSFSLKEINK